MLLHTSCVLCSGPGEVVCRRCTAQLRPAPSLAPPLGIDTCTALLHYADARPIVTSMKNGGRRDVVTWLARALSAELRPPEGAVVTWAPTGGARRRERGYDQAELLARALARRWALPCLALVRREPGPAQAGRAALERRANPSFAAPRACPRTVVVVDDVVTTGATLAAAARALRSAGASTVLAAVAARSPGRHAAARP